MRHRTAHWMKSANKQDVGFVSGEALAIERAQLSRFSFCQ